MVKEDVEDVMFDADEIEISFADAKAEREIDAAVQKEPDEKVLTEREQSAATKEQEYFELVQRAKARFDIRFFQGLAYEGPMASTLVQRDIEQTFVSLGPEDQQLLLLSIVNSAYELNHIIPNIELILFKMFVSPITTRSERKRTDSKDLLAGNIFHEQKDFKLPKQVYESLL